MPELPEVETIARRIAPHIVGKSLTRITVLHKKSVLGDASLVEGARVLAVSRRAKLLRLQFDNSYNLLLHLKMTGQILYQDAKLRLGGGHPTADWVAELPSKHTRAILEFSGGAKVYFNDMRLFGWIKVASDSEIASEFAKYGLDATDTAVTAAYFFGKLQHLRRAIKIAILDQSLIAGVGNIYANDALHLAKIHPMKAANSLSETEAARLLSAIKTVLALGIEHQGATIHTFRHIDGMAGSYQDVLRVYGCEGQPCKICSTAIERVSIGGRGTFFCPVCQPSVSP